MRTKKAVFVCYADPPCASTASVSDTKGSLIVRPQAWNMPVAKRKVLKAPIGEYSWDRDIIKPIKGAEIVGSSWDRQGGLIILGVLPVDYILDEHCTSLCACLRHWISCTRNGVTYLTGVEATGFIPQQERGGCNPGGFITFPTAEKFNKSVLECRLNGMMEADPRKIKKFKSTPKMNTVKSLKHFPKFDFSVNDSLRNYSM